MRPNLKQNALPLAEQREETPTKGSIPQDLIDCAKAAWADLDSLLTLCAATGDRTLITHAGLALGNVKMVATRAARLANQAPTIAL